MKDRIGLHDADQTRFPNLALGKLAAHYRSLGCVVEPWATLFPFDLVFSSKVFSFTPLDSGLPENAVLGGSGYGRLNSEMDAEIEHIIPDYQFLGIDYSMGFTTRGCIRSCDFCIVPAKEGRIRAHAEIGEFLHPDHKKLVLMDNNILASEHGIQQLEEVAMRGIKVDVNQGLDARLIDPPMARMLAKLRFEPGIRLACDHKRQMAHVAQAVNLIRQATGRRGKFSCYVLIQDDLQDALERIEFLMKLGIDPFAQPYRKWDGAPPLDWQRHLARWANTPARKSEPFSHYLAKAHKTKPPAKMAAGQLTFW